MKYPRAKKEIITGSILLLLIIISYPAMAQNTMKPIQTSRGTWLYVGGSGPGNYTKIQDAIDNASDGDTIIVFHGIYQEDILLNKEVCLRGINLPILSANDFYVLSIEANNCTIDNFKIPKKDNEVYIHSNNNIVSNCSTNSWIMLQNASFNYLFNNKISFEGIDLIENSNNNNISSNNISYTETGGTQYGIYISGSRNNMIFNNILCDDWRGVYLGCTLNTTLLRNRFYYCGIFIDGNNISHFNSHRIEENVLGREHLHPYYYVNKKGINVPEDAGQVFLINCSRCLINNLHNPGFDNCINLINSSGNLISDNSIQGVILGIYLQNSFSNIILNNNFNYNRYAIFLYHSDRNKIFSNVLVNNGIYLDGSNNNNILANTINNSGISVTGGRNKISFNEIKSGDLRVSGFSNSLIYNIISNSDDAIEVTGGFNIILRNQISLCDTGLSDGGLWDVIRGNRFYHNNVAIYLYSGHAKVMRNQIEMNQQGISISHGRFNIIANNNFISNSLDAQFENSIINLWLNNYWGEPLLHPKKISGSLDIIVRIYPPKTITIPWFNLDLRPRLMPLVMI
jgi:nitrous oxidase accessory protein